MDSLIQADIFFFVTTIAVVVVGIAALIALVYLILFLRDVHEFFHIVRKEAAVIIDDIEAFRENIEGKANKISKLLGVLTTARAIQKLFRFTHGSKDDNDEEDMSGANNASD